MKDNRKSENLSSVAYNAIKDAINAGELVKGDITSEVRLSQMLNMSRTPIRKAVRRLEIEGFLEMRGEKGILIKGISYRDIMNLYAVRTEMEILAARTAVHAISIEDLDDLKDQLLQLKQMSNCNLNDAKNTYLQLDQKIHQLLIDNCANNYIQLIMDMISSNMERYQKISFETLNDLPTSIDRHLKILECIRQRDPELVIRELRNNINFGKNILLPKTE